MKKLLLFGAVASSLLVGFVAGVWWDSTVYEEEFVRLETANKVLTQQMNQPTVSSPYTGEDVWQKLNEYRQAQGAPTLKLSEVACTDITGRWIMEHDKKVYSHDGMREFAQKQYQARRWLNGFIPAELLARSPSLEGTIKVLADSPSHRFIMSDPKYQYGCAYSRDGFTVIFLHKTVNDN